MEITVALDKNSYNITIEPGALARADAYMKLDRKVLLVTDSGVPAQYAKTVAACCADPVIVTIPQGESSKNLQNFELLCRTMLKEGFTRTDCVVAVGGGVVGDLAGFAAASFMRGIDFYNIPTTVLSQVDSSVGGKVAIDMDGIKNCVGAFYQPELVLCDTDCLNTLPEDVFRDGCAEVIKYGILYDPDLFSHLAEHGLNFDREKVITRCVELKRNVVAEDEFDTGARMKLNLGHTIGHGAEAQSHFEISHGKGVAIGMAIVSRAGAARGICDNRTKDAILSILDKFRLPVSCDYSAESLYRAALSDKKRSGGTVNLIIPERIGFCRIEPTPVENIQSFIEAGL